MGKSHCPFWLLTFCKTVSPYNPCNVEDKVDYSSNLKSVIVEADISFLQILQPSTKYNDLLSFFFLDVLRQLVLYTDDAFLPVGSYQRFMLKLDQIFLYKKVNEGICLTQENTSCSTEADILFEWRRIQKTTAVFHFETRTTCKMKAIGGLEKIEMKKMLEGMLQTWTLKAFKMTMNLRNNGCFLTKSST